MRKLFVRFFLGFVLVIAVVFVIQISVFTINTNRQQKLWNDNAFEAYLASFTSAVSVSTQDEWTNEYLIHVLSYCLTENDRVSGILVKDADGTLLSSLGMNRVGVPFPHDQNDGTAQSRNKNQTKNDRQFHDVKAKTDTYVVALTRTSRGLLSGYTTVTYRDKAKQQDLSLPGKLNARDIAGSINIVVDGVAVGSVDVLVFSPFSYKPFSYFLTDLMSPAFWSIPFAFLISLILAWRISKRNMKYATGIQKALSELAQGQHGVELPYTPIEEERYINNSIKELDEQLTKNQQLRMEWLRSISHDLNTPVTSMKLVLDGMSDGVFPIDEKSVALLKTENDDLVDRIAAVVFYSHLISPEKRITFSNLDPDMFIQDVMEHIGPLYKEELVTVQKEDDVLIEGDSALLSRACVELIKNGLKASPKGMTWTIGKDSMTFVNQGTLPQNVDFFEPWTRGDFSRGDSGNGLGLPIVAQVMRLHNGTVTVKMVESNVFVGISWKIA